MCIFNATLSIHPTLSFPSTSDLKIRKKKKNLKKKLLSIDFPSKCHFPNRLSIWEDTTFVLSVSETGSGMHCVNWVHFALS